MRSQNAGKFEPLLHIHDVTKNLLLIGDDITNNSSHKSLRLQQKNVRTFSTRIELFPPRPCLPTTTTTIATTTPIVLLYIPR